jgi:hypothetical protein
MADPAQVNALLWGTGSLVYILYRIIMLESIIGSPFLFLFLKGSNTITMGR